MSTLTAARYLKLSETKATTENNPTRFLESQFACSITAGGGAKFTERFTRRLATQLVTLFGMKKSSTSLFRSLLVIAIGAVSIAVSVAVSPTLAATPKLGRFLPEPDKTWLGRRVQERFWHEFSRFLY